MKNRQWILARRPRGQVSESDFALVEADLAAPDLAAGEILVRNLMLSFEPAMRGWIEDAPSYMPPVGIGEPMRAPAVARVLKSENPAYPEGALVMGLFGWQEFALAAPAGGAPMRLPDGAPPALVLGALGGSSLTAYFGLLDIGRPKAGETVVVSSAAGAVGSVAAQIARLKGCRVVGIAGGPEKCAWLREACRLEAVIDHKAEDVETRLGELCPDGIDVFFDNVGGRTLEAAIAHIAQHGRIVLCGAIATYNDAEPQPGPRNLINLITRRVRMEGFIVLDYMDRMAEAQAALQPWILSGEIKVREDIQHGFENIPRTLLRLFRGENQGKQLLSL